MYRFARRARLAPVLERVGWPGMLPDMRRPADVSMEQALEPPDPATGPGDTSTSTRPALDVKVISGVGRGHVTATAADPWAALDAYHDTARDRAHTTAVFAAQGATAVVRASLPMSRLRGRIPFPYDPGPMLCPRRPAARRCVRSRPAVRHISRMDSTTPSGRPPLARLPATATVLPAVTLIAPKTLSTPPPPAPAESNHRALPGQRGGRALLLDDCVPGLPTSAAFMLWPEFFFPSALA